MITIGTVYEKNLEKYDKAWAIVRSLKPGKYNIGHVPALSPSYELFKKYLQLKNDNKWNRQAFDEIYVPEFLKQLKFGNEEGYQILNKLYQLDKAGENIYLACFCPDESLCHRSIIAGLLQAVGCNVITKNGADYTKYFEQYRAIGLATPDESFGKSAVIENLAKTMGVKVVDAKDAAVNNNDTIAPPGIGKSGTLDNLVKNGQIELIEIKDTDPISGFFGQHRFLSNFWNAPIIYNNIRYKNSEAAFQAQKDADKNYEAFTNLAAKDAKRRGYQITMRADWAAVKDQIMYEIVLAKFSQNPDLKKKLLATGNATLIETNTWNDIYWGVCNGIGDNRLGLILMRVRNELA